MGTSKYLQFSRTWNSGGARRDRTADLYNAIVALSQLSYGPKTMRRERNDCPLGCQGGPGVKLVDFPSSDVSATIRTW